MTEDLEKAVLQLRSISPRLNEATDEATHLVAIVEQFSMMNAKSGFRRKFLLRTSVARRTLRDWLDWPIVASAGSSLLPSRLNARLQEGGPS